ncbi:MAG: hydantoinase B/oxoprolinase family protein [Phycisphaerales bacterium JB063]
MGNYPLHDDANPDRDPDRGDPIELEVFRHLFASIAEEMGERLMRSAFSPNIKERRDFSCALFDADGEMLAQAAHIPVHLGSTPLSVRAVLDAFPPTTMRPGDRFVLNDPYAGGTHLPDITVVEAVVLPASPKRPAFYVANRAHHADVGGITPGSLPIGRHIDDEGLRIAPRRMDRHTVNWIADASRTPDERRGDLLAQSAALTLGVQRLTELVEVYSLDTVAQRGKQLQDYAQRIMARVIGELPDGIYSFEDHLEDDGQGNTDIAIRCKLTIKDDHATVDLTRSDDQVAGPVNAVRAIAISAVDYCFRCLASMDLPGNGGMMRLIETITRPGSVVDAVYPAPVAGGNVETSQRLVDVVFGALAQAAPGRVPAASCGTMNNITIGGTHPATGQPFAYYETIAGGAGAGPSGPGGDALQTHMTNTHNTPIEALEHAYPMRIERYALADVLPTASDQHTGGHGVARVYHFMTPVTVTLLTERRIRRPYGLCGGSPGLAGTNTLIHPDGRRETLPAKCTRDLPAESSLEVITPGGGGWGRQSSGQCP